MIDLACRAIFKFFAGILIIGILLFGSAGTVSYPNGWLFLILLSVSIGFTGVVLFWKAPKLLEKRLKGKETDKTQGLVIKLGGLLFVSGFLLAGVCFRFQVGLLPKGAVLFGMFLFVVSYGLYWEVLRENVYLSRVIEIQEDQKVVDTGLYRIVRHPMYATSVLLFLSIPLVLGSFYAFLLFCLYPFLLTERIQKEEKLLKEELPGYVAYMEKVCYRLIPFIW